MTFFYDLNKRLSQLADKQDAKQISEDAKATTQPKSQLAQALNERDLGKHNNATTGFAALAKKAGGGNIEKGNRIAGAQLAKMRAKGQVEEGHCPACDCAPCKCNEGNAFTGKLKATPKGEKFKLGDKTFKDTSEIEEGFKEMDAWMASREKEKGTGKFDKKERTLPGGMKATTYTRKHEDDAEDDKDAPETKGGAPKKKGRPKGKDKGPERVTAKSYKYKAGRPTKTKEDLDSDSVMMTRPTNCSSESIEPGDRGEYDQEGESAKHDIKTIVRHAQALHKILGDDDNLPEWVQSKLAKIEGMMIAVDEYMQNQDQEVDEVAPPGAKAERMVKGIKKSLSKDGKLSNKDKAIAYATTWKAKKAGKVEEEGFEKHSTSALKAAAGKDRTADQKSAVPANFSTAQLKAELAKRTKDKVQEAGKPDFLDLDKDGNKAEPMKKAAKDKKEEKVDETTVAGSVATAPAGKKSAGGYNFGGGVYEGFNTQVESMITEGMNVSVNMNAGEDGETRKSITVSADGEEADQLAALLKMAGLNGQSQDCGTCGQAPCGCEQTVDEAYGDTDETLNNPDWPTDTEKLDAEPNLRTYSGGLNGPKSTGQTTVPVVASQERRLHSESVELERTLFKTWKNYKG